MTNASVFPVPHSFNPNCTRELDPEFWEAFDIWQFAAKSGGERESIAWRDMMLCTVRSAGGILAKLKALAGKPPEILDARPHDAFTFRDVLEWDAERVAKREMLAS